MAASTHEEVDSPGAGLALGMPGTWSAGDLARAQAAAEAYRKGATPPLPYHSSVVQPLAEAIDLESCLNVLDPFGDCAAVPLGLKAARLRAKVNVGRLGPAADALSEAFYVRPEGRYEAIVSAPWPALLDRALPLLVRHAARLVCCLVPLSYLCHAPPPRRAWLLALKKEGRLFFVHTSAGDVGASPAVWLVVFASAAVARGATKMYGPGTAILA